MIRVSCFIDGFNLYHALKRLDGAHLRWVNLWTLMQRQIRPKTEQLTDVFYFSAYATWLADQKVRHKEYVKALETVGVTPILGKFKEKDRKCPNCKHSWKGHEEKETDVNIAIHLLNCAYEDKFDKALLVSRDGDLKPAVELVLNKFPNKQITIVAPPHIGHSTDLVSVASAKQKIKKKQVEDCLFEKHVVDQKTSEIKAVRPNKYTPPE